MTAYTKWCTYRWPADAANDHSLPLARSILASRAEAHGYELDWRRFETWEEPALPLTDYESLVWRVAQAPIVGRVE